MELDDYTRVYTSHCKSPKAHLLDPCSSPNEFSSAACGQTPSIGDLWLGTGNWAEIYRANHKYPICKMCLRAITPLSKQFAARKAAFMEKVEQRDGHWIWLGATNYSRGGVRQPTVRGLDENQPVHGYREAYYLFRNKVVKYLYRKCDEDLCVHPDHWGAGYPTKGTGKRRYDRTTEVRPQRGRRKRVSK